MLLVAWSATFYVQKRNSLYAKFEINNHVNMKCMQWNQNLVFAVLCNVTNAVMSLYLLQCN